MKRHDVFSIAGVLVMIVVLVLANRHVFAVSGRHNIYADVVVPLPKSWPQKFPLYPRAFYLGSDQAQGQINGHWYDKAWFKTNQTSASVIRWYSRHLVRAGYPPIAVSDTDYSKKYAFNAGQRAVDMEIFVSHQLPTVYSVDFLPSAAA